MAASDGSTTISDDATVEKSASGGLYPMEYTVHYRGTYVINVTGVDGQVSVARMATLRKFSRHNEH